MQIHLINLEKSPHRLERFMHVNTALRSVIRFSAFDGKTLDLNSLLGEGRIAKETVTEFSIGAIGNAFSHLSLWDKAIETQRSVTICEDDAIFHSDFESTSSTLLTEVPDFELVSWGWNFDAALFFQLIPGVSRCLAHFDQDSMRGATEAFKSQPAAPRLFRLVQQCGTICYTISPKGAERLKKLCTPIRPLPVFYPQYQRSLPSKALDMMLNAFYEKVQAYVAVPPLVLTKNEKHDSAVDPH